jgi:hypothetical protein
MIADIAMRDVYQAGRFNSSSGSVRGDSRAKLCFAGACGEGRLTHSFSPLYVIYYHPSVS